MADCSSVLKPQLVLDGKHPVYPSCLLYSPGVRSLSMSGYWLSKSKQTFPFISRSPAFTVQLVYINIFSICFKLKLRFLRRLFHSESAFPHPTRSKSVDLDFVYLLVEKASLADALPPRLGRELEWVCKQAYKLPGVSRHKEARDQRIGAPTHGRSS